MGRHQYIQVVLRLILLILNGVLIYKFQDTIYLITTLVFIVLFIFQFILFVDYLNKLFSEAEKAIDCLLHDDFSNTFSKENQSRLNQKTAQLLKKRRKESLQRTSETLIFSNIIESLSTGILILRKDGKGHIEIFQINKAFCAFLKIPKFNHWHLLKDKIQSLSDFILEWKHMRHVVSLVINEETENFFLKTSITQTNDYQYLVVSLETIQQLIDKKEKEAWYKLMNVMSHEIINTITPISSLAESLESLLEEDPLDPENLEEVSTGLSIIKRRSYHLRSFVDTYRQLAELPLPQKETVDLSQLISNTINLFEQEFSTKNITVDFQPESSIEVNIDRKQIEQVVINILSNCIYALQSEATPEIHIQIEIGTTKVKVFISDNGIGIPDTIKANIFIPYFTTRKQGSGIGLTLAKSIMEAHQGNIHFKSTSQKTTFILTFNK
jgi:nitrogen fixation/metabolism regulation signal transduction histidine kinase